MTTSIVEELETLIKLRDQVQELDKDLLILLERRIKVAKQIIDIKRKNEKSSYSPEVEQRKIAELSKNCDLPGLVEAIWPVIMCYTRAAE